MWIHFERMRDLKINGERIEIKNLQKHGQKLQFLTESPGGAVLFLLVRAFLIVTFFCTSPISKLFPPQKKPTKQTNRQQKQLPSALAVASPLQSWTRPRRCSASRLARTPRAGTPASPWPWPCGPPWSSVSASREGQTEPGRSRPAWPSCGGPAGCWSCGNTRRSIELTDVWWLTVHDFVSEWVSDVRFGQHDSSH